MSIMRAILWRKLIRFGILGLFLSAAIYFLYPKGIFELYGRNIPPMWSSDLGNMNFKEIYEKLGSPQEDVSAKDYQNWLEYHWWGVKMLKVISSNCCKSTAKPNTVVYIVYVDGWYDPAYRKVIFKSDTEPAQGNAANMGKFPPPVQNKVRMGDLPYSPEYPYC